ncbi:unnamed protein product [[Candida] boidinii]|nr:unnamed protein product [[Candida] boidinii]
MSYLGGYGVEGSYGFDTVIIDDDIVLRDFPFAVGNVSTMEMAGILGIGLPHGEALYVSDNVTYENFAFQLVKNGVTQSATYSIALAAIDDDDKDGDFLLGAIDHSKYSGDFLRFPIPPTSLSSRLLTHVAVTLNEVYVGAAASLDDNNNINAIVKAPIYIGSVPVLLDTGSSYVNFPQSFIDGIAHHFNFTYDSYGDQYYTQCSDISTDYFVGVNTQGLDLTVPLSYLLETAELENGERVCVLMIQPSEVFVLGDNFLRGVYMAVDLQNSEVALGNANLSRKESYSDNNIEVISDTIPASTNQLYSSTEIILNGTTYPTSAEPTTLYSSFPTYYSNIYDITIDVNSPSSSNTRSSRSSSRAFTPTSASSGRSSFSTGNGVITTSRGDTTSTKTTSANAGSLNTVQYSALAFMFVNFLL